MLFFIGDEYIFRGSFEQREIPKAAGFRFDDAAVSRFWELLPRHELQLASGAWFGESERVFRLGFGYLPPDRLAPALSALSTVLDAAAK